ncbi:alpha-amylase family glycosyl hydrolase [Arcicella lustrica]|uniref:Alpha-amylase family glycosyl hydrolase n=1 Tax=Arcicella lustrica TaxID=2984196 RepID=A0ABU5SJC8_9BACT|nr:alpha-amylase family glycosyl hydrolase [Arcicella sp. DC25W]MEA5427356.1 alpha-amylase family glycosyl hydrolase [Arcicella sp. DC25W]
MKKTIFSIIFTCLLTSLFAQTPSVQRINPSNWWVGMKNPKLQLLVYGKNIAGSDVKISYQGVSLEKVNEVENPNYLFLDLNIAPNTQAGQMLIELSKNIKVQKGKKSVVDQMVKITYPFQLKVRDQKPQEINSKDFIYLILPDRFANGDPSNDKFADMADPESDRKNPFLRHGGDLLGIQNHLDYVKELGATTIWLNPVVENNQPQTNEGGAMRSAYHGYGFTDHYNVDKRLGGNEAYRKLIEAAHAKGLKIIQDAVYNHVGINHWILKDLPMKNWLNQWDTYTNTSYRDEPVVDILHGSAADFKVQQNGWFVPFLPDLNHKNEFVANFLIQHALWTVENFGIDGWRIDTYQYNDLNFMNRCNAALAEEYPKMFITGENSVQSAYSQAYFAKNNLNVPFKSTLPSANDFVLFNAINDALNQGFDWGKGFNRLYSTLAMDALYEDANLNMTFLDNHDMDRFYSVIGEDFNKYKLGVGFLLTTRGVPHLYYGTENLTKNFKNPSDAEVRKDFEGGWADDKVNKFLASGRTEKENEAFDFVKKLANYRKTSEAITTGKLTQFLPQDGIYVYFRYTDSQTVMVIMSQSKDDKSLDTQRFSERMSGFTSAKNIMTDSSVGDLESLKIPAMSITILELQK